MKRLFYHPESDSYFYEYEHVLWPEDGPIDADAALCVDVGDIVEHQEEALKRGVMPPATLDDLL